jgi:phospholipase/carboxylesterase
VVIGGFSMGCVMSLAVSLGGDLARPPVAVCGFSGFVPVAPGLAIDSSRPLPPVALGHGTLDPVIGVEFARRARDEILAAGGELLYREYPLPHAIDPRFLAEVREWLAAKLDA